MYKQYIDSYYLQGQDFVFSGAHYFISENICLLLNNGYIMLTDISLLDRIKDKRLSNDLCFKLHQMGFGKFGYEDSDGNYDDYNEKVTFFILDITQKCNMECVYCLREAESKNQTMSRDTVKDVCLYIADYCKCNEIQSILIQPWGGEPLLEFDKIKEIQEIFSEVGIYAKVGIMSNGTIVDDDILEALRKDIVEMGVSIDGFKDIHDNNRRFVSGRSSFDTVLSNIKKLQNNLGNEYGTVTTITKESSEHIEDIMEFLVVKMGVRNIKMNFVDKNKFGNYDNVCLSLDEIEKCQQKIIDKVIEFHRRGVDFKETNTAHRMQNLLQRFVSSACMSNGCKAGKRIIAFDYKGNIFPCKFTDYSEQIIGNIYSGKNLNAVLAEFRKNKCDHRDAVSKKCNNCAWLYYCGTGFTCRKMYENFEYSYDLAECTINHVVYPRLIEIILTDLDLAYKIADIY